MKHEGIHPGFETQDRRHQKSKTGAQQNELMSSQNLKKNIGNADIDLTYLSTLYFNLDRLSTVAQTSFLCVIINQYIKEFLSSKFLDEWALW